MRIFQKSFFWGASVSAAVGLLPVVGEFFVKLAEERNLYENPNAKVVVVMNTILNHPYYWPAVIFLFGLVAGSILMWIAGMLDSDDKKQIRNLEEELKSAKDVGKKTLLEIMAHQRVRTSEEVTRIRRIITDKSNSSSEKKSAFQGAEQYSDKFWYDETFAALWGEFFSACQNYYEIWSNRPKSISENSIDFSYHPKLENAKKQIDDVSKRLMKHLLQQ